MAGLLDLVQMQMASVLQLDCQQVSQEIPTMVPKIQLTTERVRQRQSRTKCTQIVKGGHQATLTRALLQEDRQRR